MSYHWIQMRFPGNERFSRAQLVEAPDDESALQAAFKQNPAALEVRYIDEATEYEVKEELTLIARGFV